MRILEIKEEIDSPTYWPARRLILDGVQSGVRWNGKTKRDLYGSSTYPEREREMAYILVAELDQELKYKNKNDGLTLEEQLFFFNQMLEHLEAYPD